MKTIRDNDYGFFSKYLNLFNIYLFFFFLLKNKEKRKTLTKLLQMCMYLHFPYPEPRSQWIKPSMEWKLHHPSESTSPVQVLAGKQESITQQRSA